MHSETSRGWPALGVLASCGLGLVLVGCALTPSGTREEQARLDLAGIPYEPRLEDRELPDLPAAPSWRDILHRAFLANGDLEASYFDWKAAVERIDMASAYPNSNVSLGYSYMFSSESMKTFDRQTFSAQFDSAMNLSFPTKVAQQGRVALDEARTSGERFRAAKFDLQQRVLSAWAEYTLLAERARVEEAQLALTRLAGDAVRARGQVAGVQTDLLRTEASLAIGEDALRNTQAELTSARAMLNGMLARDPDAPLAAPEATPPLREVRASDDVILAAGAEQNPDLAALAHQVEGRSDALELAQMQWIPDINPTAMFTGSISQALGAMVMLPTNAVEIRAGIREAEAMLRAGEAMLRQARSDRAALLVATLVALRNSERQARLFETSIVPLTERVLTNARQSYAAGSSMYLDLLDAQSMLLDARFVVAEARAAREMRLAELEALIGADIETLASDEPAPDTTPSTDTPSSDPTAPGRQENLHDH